MRCSSRLAWGKVHPEVFFSPETFQDEESKGHHRERHMVMPTIPRAPFEMVQPQFIFELLVILFYPPADFGAIDQFLQIGAFRQAGKPEIFGCVCPGRPFYQEPANRLRNLALVITRGRLGSESGEAAAQEPLSPLPPGDFLPGALRQPAGGLGSIRSRLGGRPRPE